MKDLLFALIAMLLGASLCLAGYRLARFLIPLWGLLAGFLLGASAMADALNNGFIGTTMGIVVGLIVGVVFALLAYFFFSLAVILYTAGLGYWLGTSMVLFLGFDKGFLSATIGIIVGAIFGLFALFGNLTKYFLIVVTSFGGAVIVFGGFLLLLNKIQLDAFSYASASELVSQSWFLSLLAVAAGLFGMIIQLSTNRDYTLETWGTVTGPKKVESKVE